MAWILGVEHGMCRRHPFFVFYHGSFRTDTILAVEPKETAWIRPARDHQLSGRLDLLPIGAPVCLFAVLLLCLASMEKIPFWVEGQSLLKR